MCSDLTNELAIKNYLKILSTCQNPSTESGFMELHFLVSADVYGNPKNDLGALKSVNWIISYGDVFFQFSSANIYGDLTIILAL